MADHYGHRLALPRLPNYVSRLSLACQATLDLSKGYDPHVMYHDNPAVPSRFCHPPRLPEVIKIYPRAQTPISISLSITYILAPPHNTKHSVLLFPFSARCARFFFPPSVLLSTSSKPATPASFSASPRPSRVSPNRTSSHPVNSLGSCGRYITAGTGARIITDLPARLNQLESMSSRDGERERERERNKPSPSLHRFVFAFLPSAHFVVPCST